MKTHWEWIKIAIKNSISIFSTIRHYRLLILWEIIFNRHCLVESIYFEHLLY